MLTQTRQHISREYVKANVRAQFMRQILSVSSRGTNMNVNSLFPLTGQVQTEKQLEVKVS